MRRPAKHGRPVLLAVFSDVHAGGTTALCPDVVPLDDGNAHLASKAQKWLMQCWRDYWEKIAAKRDQLDAELYIVSNGDLVEGDHHNTSKIISRNLAAQKIAIAKILEIPLALKPDRIIIIRGTEAHVGESGSAEESIADGLKRDKRPVVVDEATGVCSWWHWRPEIQGVRLDFTHHGKMGRLARTRKSNLVLYAWDIVDEHVETGHPHPHVAFRGHNHKRGDSHEAAPTRVVATGAWQLGTSGYVKKVAPDSLSDIGGAYAVIDHGECEVKHITYQPERPVWRPS